MLQIFICYVCLFGDGYSSFMEVLNNKRLNIKMLYQFKRSSVLQKNEK